MVRLTDCLDITIVVDGMTNHKTNKNKYLHKICLNEVGLMADQSTLFAVLSASFGHISVW